jgi:hypothetical protein
MRVISDAPIPGTEDLFHTLVERAPDEDLHTSVADGFYQIGHVVVPGHYLNDMRRVAWDVEAQEWKVVR